VRNTGQQYLDNTGNEDRTIDPWTTVDLSVWFDLGGLGWRSLDGATVFAHLRNLADTEYEVWGYWYGENYYTPAAGFNFAVGIDYGF
jgi:iron complex outermembrane receptor protein